MNAVKLIALSVAGFVLLGNQAQAQYIPGYTPGFGGMAYGSNNYYSAGTYNQNRFYTTPYGINSVNRTITPWLNQVTYNQTYIDRWNGVAYQKQYFSNPLGTYSTVRMYDPWVGPATYYYQQPPSTVYNQQNVNYGGVYRPGFTWNR